MKLRLLLFLLAFLISVTLINAQDTDSTDADDEDWSGDDSTWFDEDNDDDFNWEWDDWDDRFEFDLFKFDRKMPSITLNYGISQISKRGFSDNFADPNLIEVKLGYTRQEKEWRKSSILDYNYRYFLVSNTSTDLSNIASGQSLRTDMWRFAFGFANGYGYDLGMSAIIPYTDYSFTWSKIDFKDIPVSNQGIEQINLYHDTFRFGNSVEAGIRFKVIPQIVLEGGYERSVIYPRHLFWKWAGAELIQVSGVALLDTFIKQIIKTSPYAVPVVNALLKGAFYYGMYELKQEKMNWPFETDSPIAYDQFKFGMTFMF